MNPGEGSSTMFCAECSRPVDPRTGHCPFCGVWSLEDTSTSHAFQGATPPSQATTPPPGMPWAPPQQPSYATPPPAFDLPRSDKVAEMVAKVAAKRELQT